MSQDSEKRQQKYHPTQTLILQRFIKKLWRQIVDKVGKTTQVGRSLASKSSWTTRLDEIVSKVWDQAPVVI